MKKQQSLSRILNNRSGFSMFEILAVFAMLTVIMGIAVVNLKNFQRKSLDASVQIVAFIKQTRSRAMTTTQAYRVFPADAGRIAVEYANKCSDTTWTSDAALILDLPEGSSLSSTSWSTCFNSRGFPDNNVTFHVTDENNETQQIDVLLGGTVRKI